MAEILPFAEWAACPERPGRATAGEPARSAPADAGARAAALDIRRSCIVEAPAGSGKTGLLVQRFLKLLAGNDADPALAGPEQPEEVLAMTFTRKATSELRQRVLEQLQAAAEGVPLGKESAGTGGFERETRDLAAAVLSRSEQMGWNLLAQPQRLNIRSILSVCLEIASSLPLLSGGGARLQPSDDPKPLYRQAARRTLLQLGGPNQALHHALRTVLLHRDGNLSDCETLLAQMLESRDQWAELVPLDPGALDDATLDREVRPKLERALENIVCAGLTRALEAMPPRTLRELTALAARLSLQPAYKGESPIALCAQRHEPPEAVAAHLDHWVALVGLLLTSEGKWRTSLNRNHLGFDISRDDRVLLRLFIEEIQNDRLREALRAVRALPPARYPDDQWIVAKSLFHVLRHALAELKILFAARGECDYVELALAAREALSSGEAAPDITLSAGGRLRHLLVDELQDTSASQFELIKRLTSSWDGHSQTIFLVGDPKQSIYLFRQARVERFLRIMREERLGEIQLSALRLTANFRSQAALVAGFNDTFGGSEDTGRIFPPPGDSSLRGGGAADVPFSPATASRPRTVPDAIVWHTAVLGEENYDPSIRPTANNAQDHAAQEALEIRRLIEQQLALPLPEGRDKPRNLKPWRIAILARARRHLSAIIQELKAHAGKPAVAFRAVNLDPLSELPEVLDVLALTRAVLHPGDRVAWLAVLHAPWCGLGLADLLALTGEGAVQGRGETAGADGSGGESLEISISPDSHAGPSDSYASVAELVRTRRQHLSPLGQRLLDRSWPVLETAAATRGCAPLAVHIERTWRSLGGDAPLSAGQRGNVFRFLELLRKVERESGLAGRDLLNELTAKLQDLYAEPGNLLPDDPQGGQASPTGQVELMTIHNAKGLEWDMVLIPGLERGTGRDRPSLLDWLEFDDAGSGPEEAALLLAPIWRKGDISGALNSCLRSIRAERERAEEKRLFYVAATRAREQLHLFGAVGRRTSGMRGDPAPGTLLKACWPAAETHFTQYMAPPESGAASPPAALGPELVADPDLPADPEAEPAPGLEPESAAPPPLIQRLPLSFDPAERFRRAAAQRLPYTQGSSLSHAPAFERPEGSLAARAFGNVVHRYLQAMAGRLAAQASPGAMAGELDAAELNTWEPRLQASLRAEGLPPSAVVREAARALRALQLTLSDPIGRWILAPHPRAASERTLTTACLQSFRVDRTFVAGDAPRTADDGCIWIIDFKTTEPGARPEDRFAAAEIARYTAQLEAYAAIRRSLPDGNHPIRLGLFYPLVPRLLHWLSGAAIPTMEPATMEPATEQSGSAILRSRF